MYIFIYSHNKIYTYIRNGHVKCARNGPSGALFRVYSGLLPFINLRNSWKIVQVAKDSVTITVVVLIPLIDMYKHAIRN